MLQMIDHYYQEFTEAFDRPAPTTANTNKKS
jgi:hypothetical protein